MRICVVGSGAVGSLFAANLAQLDDVEVWAYDLAQEHVDAINRDGLRLTGAGEVTGRVRATSDTAGAFAAACRVHNHRNRPVLNSTSATAAMTSAANPRAWAGGNSMTPTSATSSFGITPRIPHSGLPRSAMAQTRRESP